MADLTLKAQILTEARSVLGDAAVEGLSFPRIVDALAIEAFKGRWKESNVTRAIRLALRLIDENGYISSDEPALKAKRGSRG